MTTPQILNVSFDVWDVLFCAVLLVGALVTRRYEPKLARFLIGLLLANMVLNSCEVLAYVFRGDESALGYYMVRVANFVVFLCNHLLLALSAHFIIYSIRKRGGVVPRALEYTILGVIVIGIFMLVASRIFGFYYAFDDQNVYYRLPSFVVMLIPEGVCMVMLQVLILMNIRRLSPMERVSFIAFMLLPLVGLALQSTTYGVSLSTFVTTAALALMFMTYEIDCSRAILDRERSLMEQIVSTLVQAIDAKDAYTNGHSLRVTRYSCMLAERMGLSQEEVDRIRQMAVLHDVGKIGIPDNVLNKNARLDDEEYALIKSHTTQGSDMLSNVTSMPDLRTGARRHHERYDGKGYPDGLAGEDIPMEARIICVADSYDAMTSDRAYRKHLDQDVVRGEIERCSGSQFDPEVARAMIQIIDEDTSYKLHG